ncbi:hypothetical protein AB0B31_04135 [Catellatospora citrea]|uniref:hypothetical protein n=1 Tax=Catellatospora citrea TaxID=53366 RepID=UPI0033E5233D
MSNRGDDYLFDGWADHGSSPLTACLNAGWRTGLTGVSDEHGTNWGFPEGKGRTGLWVAANTRAGANPSPGPAGDPCNDWGVAYASPWWLRP